MDWFIAFPGTLSVLVMLVYLSTFYRVYIRRRELRFERAFDLALVTYLEANEPREDVARQLSLVFRQLQQYFRRAPVWAKRPADMVERFVARHSTLSEPNFKTILGVEKIDRHRKEALTVLDFLKESNPYESLPPKAASLMRNLDEAISAQNQGFAKNLLSQLSEEIEGLDKLLSVERERSSASLMVAAVGAALTIVFGLASIVLSIVLVLSST